MKIFGARAVVGHIAVKFLEDDRLFVSLDNVDDEACPCMAHNTQIGNLESIILNGLAPGEDGMTEAVHSQLSALHMHDPRVQDNSRASTSDATILCDVKKTKPPSEGGHQWGTSPQEAYPRIVHSQDLDQAECPLQTPRRTLHRAKTVDYSLRHARAGNDHYWLGWRSEAGAFRRVQKRYGEAQQVFVRPTLRGCVQKHGQEVRLRGNEREVLPTVRLSDDGCCGRLLCNVA